MHTLTQVASPSDGTPITKLTPLLEGHLLAAIISLPPKDERPDGWFVLSITRQGMVKKSALAELPGPTAQPFVLVKVNSGDRLGWIRLTDGQAGVLLGTLQGMVIRFLESDIRPMGLVAAGVMGIKLQENDEVIAAELAPKQGEVLLIASDGSGKRVSAAQFPTQGRYGQGVTAWNLPRGVQMIGMVVGGETTQVLLQITRQPSRIILMGDTVHQGRSARGKSLVQLKKDEYVDGLTVPWEPLRLKTEKEVIKPGKSLPRGTKSK